MKQCILSLVAVAAATSLSACGGDSGGGGETDAVSQAVESGILSNAYLEGEWCYDHYEADGQVEQEQIGYRFDADGGLMYQAESDGPIDQEGSYEIGRRGLTISPAFDAFPPMRAVSIDADRLTLLAMEAQLVWTRGPCA
ncbi:MAG: hypothetical protein RLN87_01845 [Parasphingopyxis sp.]|uniref:hypothetical protein n=1 Tax=Parasphingopyxis sp. TaxID=1920299 RepID=UPI0032EDB860